MSESPQALAWQAAEAVRSLNHAAGGIGQPGDAYDVLGGLSLAASRLPQALDRLGRWLDAALAGGRRACPDGSDPVLAVGGTRAFLDGARGSAAALADNLSLAQQQLSAVGGQPEPEEQP